MVTTSSELYPPQNGDFVIQTSDDVLFGVHRILLVLSSPVMSDMFALGATNGVQPAPGALLLLPFDETLCLFIYFDRTVSISEDSGTFQNLLSFIYPDKTSTVFTSLDLLLPVLTAASKYQMRAVVDKLTAQMVSRSISGNTYREPLLYDDPLSLYVKAKEFDLGDLANAAANATLSVDITRAPDSCSDLARMPAIWLWQLLSIRKERTDWLLKMCGSDFHIGSMNHHYQRQYGHPLFQTFRCSCALSTDVSTKGIPAPLLDKIKAYPCPRSIRKIDFNVEQGCLRCGAAATVHFDKICKKYEEVFGIF